MSLAKRSYLVQGHPLWEQPLSCGWVIWHKVYEGSWPVSELPGILRLPGSCYSSFASAQTCFLCSHTGANSERTLISFLHANLHSKLRFLVSSSYCSMAVSFSGISYFIEYVYMPFSFASHSETPQMPIFICLTVSQRSWRLSSFFLIFLLSDGLFQKNCLHTHIFFLLLGLLCYWGFQLYFLFELLSSSFSRFLFSLLLRSPSLCWLSHSHHVLFS